MKPQQTLLYSLMMAETMLPHNVHPLDIVKREGGPSGPPQTWSRGNYEERKKAEKEAKRQAWLEKQAEKV